VVVGAVVVGDGVGDAVGDTVGVDVDGGVGDDVVWAAVQLVQYK